MFLASNRLQGLKRWIFASEDAGALALFRIGFGLVMTWTMWRFLTARWVQRYFFQEKFLFKYTFFEWIHPLPPPMMWVVLWTGVIAAIGVCLGLCYRLSALLLFFVHTYIFLLSASHYLNHAYLISILAMLMVFLPASRALSVDAWWSSYTPSSHLPRWPRMLMIFQIGIVYFFAGIAKINSDWLYYQMPVVRWMRSSAKNVPWGEEIIASWLAKYIVAWGGCLFDLLIVPAMLWPVTRKLAVLAAVGFHLSNFYMFNIGVFPWMMLALTPVFFSADWYRRIKWLGPLLGRWVNRGRPRPVPSPHQQNLIMSLLTIWVLCQLLLPLRHHLYPGNVAWTEEGHKYAWRMKLRSKRGRATFVVKDPQTGKTWNVRPGKELSRRQLRKLPGQPELIIQYAHHLDKRYREEFGVEDPQVFGNVFLSLNYREYMRFIDPDVDLSTQTNSLDSLPCILPFAWHPPPNK